MTKKPKKKINIRKIKKAREAKGKPVKLVKAYQARKKVNNLLNIHADLERAINKFVINLIQDHQIRGNEDTVKLFIDVYKSLLDVSEDIKKLMRPGTPRRKNYGKK